MTAWPDSSRDTSSPAESIATEASRQPGSERRHIGCISTSRADAGIYQSLFTTLAENPRWRVTCFAGGTHGSSDFGNTRDTLRSVQDVEVVPVDHRVPGDGPEQVAETAGRGTIAFSRALARTDPDLVFVLGDRTEMLAAAVAAVIHRIPIAHLHGGERTEGAYDDVCRHATTKMAHLHFPALPEYADRIRAMGEEDWRIQTVGALALDGLNAFQPEPVGELSASLGLDFSMPTTVVAYHPETLAEQTPPAQLEPLLAALGEIDANLLIIGTNADVGHGSFGRAFRAFVADRSRARLIPSLSRDRFWSCLHYANLLIGNSSAGIIEAASFRLPVVNIGQRQAGRRRLPNIVDTPADRAEISAAIRRATSQDFREGLAGLVNPHAFGGGAVRVVDVLRNLPDRDRLLRKRWPA